MSVSTPPPQNKVPSHRPKESVRDIHGGRPGAWRAPSVGRCAHSQRARLPHPFAASLSLAVRTVVVAVKRSIGTLDDRT